MGSHSPAAGEKGKDGRGKEVKGPVSANICGGGGQTSWGQPKGLPLARPVATYDLERTSSLCLAKRSSHEQFPARIMLSDGASSRFMNAAAFKSWAPARGPRSSASNNDLVGDSSFAQGTQGQILVVRIVLHEQNGLIAHPRSYPRKPRSADLGKLHAPNRTNGPQGHSIPEQDALVPLPVPRLVWSISPPRDCVFGSES